jgi:type IV pilus assembly protein PilV
MTSQERFAPHLSRWRNAGFTLMEVLIALVVLSIGLLGLAALQATGTRNIHTSYLRSQAVVQAYDMADRMRSNLQGVSAGYYSDLSGIPTSPPDCTSTQCNPEQLAELDLAQWNIANRDVLPGPGAGTVTIATGTGGCAIANCICTITVSWDEIEGGTSVTKSFVTTFQPFSQPL